MSYRDYSGHGGDRRQGGDRGGYSDRGAFGDRGRYSDRGGYSDRGSFSDHSNRGYSDRERSYTPYGRGRGGDRGGRGGDRGGRGGGRGGRGGGGDHSFDPHPNMGPVQPRLPERIDVITPKDIQVNCSVLNIARAKPVFQYELKVKGFKGKSDNETGLDMYKTPSTDGARNAKYRAFNEIYKILLDQNQTLFKSDEKNEEGNFKHLYVFDRSCIFYSDLDFNVDVNERTFTIDTDSIPYEHRSYVAGMKTLEIRLVKAGKLDPASVLGQPDSVQRPILQYFDILFDQLAYANDRYFIFNNKMFFKDINEKVLNPNYVLKNGLQKNIRVTEKGLVLQVDPKKTCFYAALPLIEFLRNERVTNRDLESPRCKNDILKLIKGLYVRTTHMEFNRTFPISSMSDLPANEIYFEFEGKRTDVAEYFGKRYGRFLRHPSYLCVEKRGSFFPLEHLEIVDGQRVQRERMSPDLNQHMIRACQMKPVDLLRNLEDQLPEAGFMNLNFYLKLSGIRIVNPRLEVRGQELPKPAIVYKDGIMKLRSGGWRQDNGTYLCSATISKLAIVIAGRTFVDERRWVSDLIGSAEQKGLNIREHNIIVLDVNVNDRDAVMHFAQRLVNEGYDFLLFLCDSKDLHQAIKFSEIGTKVCTQQVKMDSMKKGRDTLGNIIHKMNLKAGGRNYGVCSNPEVANRMRCDVVKSLLETTCVVGIEMSHPAAQERVDRLLKVDNPEPTTVGIAHTVDSTGCVGNGDYFYVSRGTAVIEHPKLVEIIQNALREFHLKSGKHATRLLIYRSGISEGSFSDVAQKECANIVRLIQRSNLPTAVTMVVMQRKTNHRLFPQRTVMESMSPQLGAAQQNVGPGTSINSGVTNPRYKEFVMIAHRALLGTAKPVVGTLIFESVPGNLNIQQLEQVTHALCYQHEIVTAPIALPGPLRSASDLALRGLNNWKVALNSGTLAIVERDYQREYTAEEEKTMVQKTFDRHNDALCPTIIDRKFWA